MYDDMNKLLIIDDDKSICKTLELHLRRYGYDVSFAHTGKDGIGLVIDKKPDVVILDIKLPDIDGIEVLRQIKSIDSNKYVIMITAFQDMETTIKAMQEGAFEYINKPISIYELDRAIENAVNSIKILAEEREEIIEIPKVTVGEGNIIGKSKIMKEIFKTIGVVSQSRTTILIEGESGTGKELIAKAIHFNSKDKKYPFISINCSAIVETLLESELFGHEKGAFTGALYRKDGKFTLANNGTLFLDEIGEMSLNLQAKLLRVLQEREFERVGGKEKIKTNVRVITATNKKLDNLVKEGKFREDLYYRLKVVTIDVPPLRDRKEDIPLLVEYVINKVNNELHRNVRKLSKRALELLINHEWVGNVRELENVITRGILLSRDDRLGEEHFSAILKSNADKLFKQKLVEDVDGKPMFETKIDSLDEIEKIHIFKVLNYTNWHKGKACEILGLTRPRLERKIKKYNIQPLVKKSLFYKEIS
jgi:two-component system response regulator AtoC